MLFVNSEIRVITNLPHRQNAWNCCGTCVQVVTRNWSDATSKCTHEIGRNSPLHVDVLRTTRASCTGLQSCHWMFFLALLWCYEMAARSCQLLFPQATAWAMMMWWMAYFYATDLQSCCWICPVQGVDWTILADNHYANDAAQHWPGWWFIGCHRWH